MSGPLGRKRGSVETQTVRVGGVSKTYGVYKSKEAAVASPPPFFQSAVDVLVPFHGQYLKVRNLVESIMLNTKTTRFRVTLIDDGSPNQNFVPDIRKQAPVEHIRLPNRAGFGAALRAGFEATDLPWVCVVHSDAVVGTMDWLARLGQSLLSLKSQNVRMVHARTDNPGGEFLALRGSRIPVVSTHDGEPGLLDNIGSIVGTQQEALAVRKHSKCGRPMDVFGYHHIDAAALVEAVHRMLEAAAKEELLISPRALQG